MQVSTLFFLCLLGSFAGLLMGLLKPSLFTLKDGSVPARWKLASVWAFLIVASLIGTGVHSDREKAALARLYEQPSAETTETPEAPAAEPADADAAAAAERAAAEAAERGRPAAQEAAPAKSDEPAQ